MPFIMNVSLADIARGDHPDPTWKKTVLIQIVDVCMEFPKPKATFAGVHQFEFLDIEDEDPNSEILGIREDQAADIVAILKSALEDDANVIVHCVAGLCRSGAVAEVGIMLGFDEVEGCVRMPNLRVKRMLLEELGYSYGYDYDPWASAEESSILTYQPSGKSSELAFPADSDGV